MLVTIKGQNLATTTETATFPWPTQFGGTSVKFGFYSHAAIYSVSPTQINVIVPGDDSSLFPDGPLIGFSSLLLTTASGSASAGLIGYHSALGIFTQDMSGCGQPAAYNIHADGSLSLNTPQNSLDPVNDFGLAIWLTGLGRFADRIDGAPWQYNPVDNTAGSFLKAIVGFPDNLPNVRTDVEPFVIVYAGPAPGLSGVDQVNLTFPSQPSLLLDSSTARVRHQGCHVPLYLTDNSYSASQLVSVSIKDGGGACVDPAPSSLGTVNWQKTLVSDTNGLSSSDGVSAMFWKGAWIDFPAPPQDGSFHYSFGPYEFGPPTPQPTVCPSLSPVTLDVGPIAVTGPASLSLVASNSGSFINYAASLPKGTITGGSYQISGNGFSDTESIPPPITVTTNLAPGTKVKNSVTVNWTGGNDQSVVTITLRIRAVLADFGTQFFMASQTVLASKGVATIPLCELLSNGFCNPSESPGSAVEVLVNQQRAVGTPPAENASPPFSVPGLSLGGEQVWTYTWDFRGLSIDFP